MDDLLSRGAALDADAALSEDLAVAPSEAKFAVATQRQLMWWRFKKHRVAMVSLVVVGLFYFVALFADFFAYADPNTSDATYTHAPPGRIHFFGQPGQPWWYPHVHPIIGSRDPRTFTLSYVEDDTTSYKVSFFGHGYEYKLLGLIPTDRHLIAVEGAPAETSLYLFGADQLGRDLYSRLIHATRTSLTIGLAGVFLSLVLGVVLGGVSGYYGGWPDAIIQRIIEILRSVPTIPLWMGLAAALPPEWSVTSVYFAITIIISLIGWTALGRVVRGRFLQLRSEEFVLAAELAGARPRRIMFVHMLPLFFSHVIAATTLALPLMIIAETSLSFLGLGLRPPAISWGVLLQDAQNVSAIALTPWLLIPVIPVILSILAFNFLGDGLRDAADPYGL